MSVRSDIKQLVREIGVPSVNGQCAGVAVSIRLVFDGDPIPDPPECPLCDKRHWPALEVQRICIVEVRRSYGPPAEMHE
jgi:hypothetical protein